MKAKNILTFLLGSLVASGIWAFSERKAQRPVEQMEAIPASVALDCLPPTTGELLKFRTLLRTREVFSAGISSVGIGVDKEAAHGLYRDIGTSGPMAVCPPDDFYQELSRIFASNPDAFRYRPVRWTLELLSKLPVKQKSWMNHLAAAAFSELPVSDDVLTWKDIRPLAMATLATFGSMAEPYSQKAFERASSADAIGTGAAQVAVATRHPRAVEMVTQLVRTELTLYPPATVIPFHRKLRLYELAYAVGYAEQNGEDAFQVFTPMMDRKVQTPSHFGMIELEPRELCGIMRRSNSGRSSTLLNHPICNDGQRSDYP